MIILRSTDFKREPGNDMWGALIEDAKDQNLIDRNLEDENTENYEIYVTIKAIQPSFPLKGV